MTTNQKVYGERLLQAVGYAPSRDGKLAEHLIPVGQLGELRKFGVNEPVQISYYIQPNGKTIAFYPKLLHDKSFLGKGNTLDDAIMALIPKLKNDAWFVKLNLGHYDNPTFPASVDK